MSSQEEGEHSPPRDGQDPDQGGGSSNTGEGGRPTRRRKGRHHAINTTGIDNIRHKLTWNTEGQPTGEYRQRLVTYLGKLARNYFSPHSKDWRLVDRNRKNTVWGFIKETWALEDCRRKFVESEIGKLWKEWKAKLTISITEAMQLPSEAEAEAAIEGLRPDHVELEEWDQFVTYRRSQEFTEKSAKAKSNIQGNQCRPRTGRMSFVVFSDELSKDKAKKGLPPKVTRTETYVAARTRPDKANPPILKGQLKEAIDAIAQMEDTGDLSTDPVSQFYGPEHPGRVRGYGHGVSPSSVNVNVYSGCNSRYESELQQLKDTVASMKSVLDSFVNQGAGTSSTPVAGQSSSNYQCANVVYSGLRVEAGSHEELYGAHCDLLDFESPVRHVVARGILVETNPRASYESMWVGKCNCIVKVVDVLLHDYELPVPTMTAIILRDAVMKDILWPRSHIEVVRDTP